MGFRPQSPSLWRKIVGWAFIAVGLLGIILPIIPGIPLLIVGLMTLATQHRWAHQLLVWSKSRFRSVWRKHGRRAASKMNGQAPK